MIAHFSAQLSGGANLAGFRLHTAQRRLGHDSQFYYGTGDSNDPNVHPLYQNNSFLRRNLVALAISWRSRQQTPTGFVSNPRWIRRTPIQPIGTMPSVVNLHWVARWLDLPTFFASLPEGMPIIWTLHDLIPITGGCHYPYECSGFTQGCGNCPQFKPPFRHRYDATWRFFRTKAKWYPRVNLHFVGNSAWTTQQANRSALMKLGKSVRTINYGLDPEAYKPVEKAMAQRGLGLTEGKFVIGFSCSDFHEVRKGATILLEALKIFPADKVLLVVMGGGKWPRNATDVETVVLGSIGSTRIQSIFYSALDVFAMPSFVETFGNVAMEAMACQTPVVGFTAGGLTDVVAEGETGLLDADIGSVAALARMLHWMWTHPQERAQMGMAGRERVLKHFTDTLMAQRYLELYDELTRETAPVG